jgi:hypothetical protein
LSAEHIDAVREWREKREKRKRRERESGERREREKREKREKRGEETERWKKRRVNCWRAIPFNNRHFVPQTKAFERSIGLSHEQTNTHLTTAHTHTHTYPVLQADAQQQRLLDGGQRRVDLAQEPLARNWGKAGNGGKEKHRETNRQTNISTHAHTQTHTNTHNTHTRTCREEIQDGMHVDEVLRICVKPLEVVRRHQLLQLLRAHHTLFLLPCVSSWSLLWRHHSSARRGSATRKRRPFRALQHIEAQAGRQGSELVREQGQEATSEVLPVDVEPACVRGGAAGAGQRAQHDAAVFARQVVLGKEVVWDSRERERERGRENEGERKQQSTHTRTHTLTGVWRTYTGVNPQRFQNLNSSLVRPKDTPT